MSMRWWVPWVGCSTVVVLAVYSATGEHSRCCTELEIAPLIANVTSIPVMELSLEERLFVVDIGVHEDEFFIWLQSLSIASRRCRNAVPDPVPCHVVPSGTSSNQEILFVVYVETTYPGNALTEHCQSDEERIVASCDVSASNAFFGALPASGVVRVAFVYNVIRRPTIGGTLIIVAASALAAMTAIAASLCAYRCYRKRRRRWSLLMARRTSEAEPDSREWLLQHRLEREFSAQQRRLSVTLDDE